MENLPEDEVQGTEPAIDRTVVPGAAEPEAEPAQPDPDAPGDETPESEPKPSGFEKRISKLTWQREEAMRREAEASRQAAYYKGLAEGKGAPQPGAPQAKDGPPKQEDFESYELYLRAVADHQVTTRMAQERQRLTEEMAARELQVGFEQRLEAFREIRPDFDFDEIARDERLAISTHMAEAIRNVDDGPAIALHFRDNPEEAQRIYRLNPNHQIFALGQLSARLAAPAPAPKPQASAAPAPIKPIRGTDGTFQKDPERMTDAEWWRSQKRSTR